MGYRNGFESHLESTLYALAKKVQAWKREIWSGNRFNNHQHTDTIENK